MNICKHCKHWNASNPTTDNAGSRHVECANPANNHESLSVTGCVPFGVHFQPAYLATKENFGCVNWERKTIEIGLCRDCDNWSKIENGDFRTCRQIEMKTRPGFGCVHWKPQ